MRCVLEGTLLACGKTRVWSLAQERKANQVLARGIRRCLGLDRHNMREFGYSDESLRILVQWDHFSTLIHRSTLRWLGHVARMNCHRLPKIALFGWPKGHEERRSGRYTFPLWAQWLLSQHGIPLMDWFRLAQKPTRRWVRIVNKALPRRRELGTAAAVHDPLQCPACSFLASTSKGLQVHYDSEHAVQGTTLTTVGLELAGSVSRCLCFKRKSHGIAAP